MTDVTESVDVNVPVTTAYNQWTQFESFPQFMDGVESVRQLDDRHTHWVTEIAGVRREFDAEITEQHPDERIAWKSVGGDSLHAGVVTFHRLNDAQTRVTVQLSWQPQGLTEKVGSALHADNRQVKADTARFKSFIEQRGVETGGYRGEHAAPGHGGFTG
ncbi:MAG TPA: SRPBCC family protein [Actinospica sp.]|nr:SRPBCC family protein [Actinospica sp.]